MKEIDKRAILDWDQFKKDIENGIVPDVLMTMTSTDKDDIIEKAILLIHSFVP